MEEKKYVWVLLEESDVLTEKDHMPGVMHRIISVFSDFEKAKSKMQRLIKKYAFTDNDLFDGNGNIIGLSEYAEEYESDIELLKETESPENMEAYIKHVQACRGELSLKPIEKLLREYFNSDGDYHISEDLHSFLANDHLSECQVVKTDYGYKFSFESFEPHQTDFCIAVNSFVMNDPAQSYYCTIHNQFFVWDDCYKLNITLCRVDLDDWEYDK